MRTNLVLVRSLDGYYVPYSGYGDVFRRYLQEDRIAESDYAYAEKYLDSQGYSLAIACCICQCCYGRE